MSAECRRRPPVVAELSDDELGHALIATAAGSWDEEAAVGLIVAHWRWLGRGEFRQAVEADWGYEGELMAWVDWERIDVASAAASSSEIRLLALARSLGGVASDRPLSDLLSSLDVANTARVLDAMSVAASGVPVGRRSR